MFPDFAASLPLPHPFHGVLFDLPLGGSGRMRGRRQGRAHFHRNHQYSNVSQVLPTLHGLYWESGQQIPHEDESKMVEVEIAIEDDPEQVEGEEDRMGDKEGRGKYRGRTLTRLILSLLAGAFDRPFPSK
jgi:hypothetical protein